MMGMIVDAHVHLKHGDIRRTEYSPEVIVETMDRVGIDKSVVFAMSTTTKRSIEMALEAVRKYPDRLIPFVYALPNYECTLAEYVTDPVIALAERLGVPCLIDCMGRFWDIERMAKCFPEAKLIVAHLGRYLCEDEVLIDRFIELALKYRNIFLDVSGVALTHKIREAVSKVGSDRVIFGTDGPHEAPDTVGFAKKELDKIRALNLDPEDEEAVLGGTIARLLRI